MIIRFNKKFIIAFFAFLLLGSCAVQHNTPGYFSKKATSKSVWDVLRENFELAHFAEHPRVKDQIAWYQKNPLHIKTIFDQSTPYKHYIVQNVLDRNFPAEIALLPAIESSYDPFAYSRAGAAGLWQLMPGTASGLGIKQDWWFDGRRDITDSTNAALDYLAYLNNRFDGNWLLTIAAYNAGAGNVNRALTRQKASPDDVDVWELRLPRETQRYLPKLLALAAIIADPETYGFSLPDIQNEAYLVKIDIGSQIDLAYVAELAEMELTRVHQLNPGHNRWATHPDGPFHLLLPADHAEILMTKLADTPAHERITWQHHRVGSGDTLGGLAQKYGTSIAVIRRINEIEGNLIRIGQNLLIPQGPANAPVRAPEIQQLFADLERNKRYGPQQVIHTVKSGDSLARIARKYGVQTSAVRYWNSKINGKGLQPGMELVLWVPNRSARTYTVRSGDTLSRIAQRHGTNSATIARLNSMSREAIIRPGQKLRVG